MLSSAITPQFCMRCFCWVFLAGVIGVIGRYFPPVTPSAGLSVCFRSPISSSVTDVTDVTGTLRADLPTPLHRSAQKPAHRSYRACPGGTIYFGVMEPWPRLHLVTMTSYSVALHIRISRRLPRHARQHFHTVELPGMDRSKVRCDAPLKAVVRQHHVARERRQGSVLLGLPATSRPSLRFRRPELDRRR